MTYVAAAYTSVILLFGGYSLWLAARLRRVEKRLDELKKS